MAPLSPLVARKGVGSICQEAARPYRTSVLALCITNGATLLLFLIFILSSIKHFRKLRAKHSGLKLLYESVASELSSDRALIETYEPYIKKLHMRLDRMNDQVVTYRAYFVERGIAPPPTRHHDLPSSADAADEVLNPFTFGSDLDDSDDDQSSVVITTARAQPLRPTRARRAFSRGSSPPALILTPSTSSPGSIDLTGKSPSSALRPRRASPPPAVQTDGGIRDSVTPIEETGGSSARHRVLTARGAPRSPGPRSPPAHRGGVANSAIVPSPLHQSFDHISNSSDEGGGSRDEEVDAFSTFSGIHIMSPGPETHFGGVETRGTAEGAEPRASVGDENKIGYAV